MYDHIPHLVAIDELLVHARSALPDAPQVPPVVRLPRLRATTSSMLRRAADRIHQEPPRIVPAHAQPC